MVSSSHLLQEQIEVLCSHLFLIPAYEICTFLTVPMKTTHISFQINPKNWPLLHCYRIRISQTFQNLALWMMSQEYRRQLPMVNQEGHPIRLVQVQVQNCSKSCCFR